MYMGGGGGGVYVDCTLQLLQGCRLDCSLLLVMIASYVIT